MTIAEEFAQEIDDLLDKYAHPPHMNSWMDSRIFGWTAVIRLLQHIATALREGKTYQKFDEHWSSKRGRWWGFK